MKPTIADVADAAGVSRASVSFAFNRPARVAAPTLERILSVAAELGYVPDPVARSMSSGRTGTIGILVPQPLASMAHNPFFSEFLSGVATVTEAGELPIMLVSPRQGSMEHAVNGAAVDGFLTLGLEEFRPTVQMLEARRLPFVMIDSEPVEGIACVNSDDVGGAYQAMRTVLKAGHRHIGLLGIRSPHPGSWRRYTGTLARRIDGYRRGLADVGMDIDDVTLVESKTSEQHGIKATQRLLERNPDITAIVSMSDITALGALQAATKHNLNVPADLTIVGFDGIPEARWSRPALTTISQNPRDKGRVAAETLVGLIHQTHQPEHLTLATTLIRGQTVAPPR